MSYTLLRKKLEKESHDLLMDLNGFCMALSERIKTRRVEITKSEAGYEVTLKGTGLDMEKKIYSLKNGEPDYEINTETGAMTAFWNTSKHVARLPPRVVEVIKNTVETTMLELT